MTCSQFVAKLLDETDAVTLPKYPLLMRPKDFLTVNGMTLVYIGTIAGCNFKSECITAKKQT